jgi:aspartate beta-hydroxylase
MQRPLLYYPGLRRQPWYDPAELPWTAALRSDFVTIRRELDQCLSRQQGFESAFPEYTTDGKWATLWFYLYGARRDDNAAAFPRTMEIIESIPRLAGWAAYSALAPGTHIKAHCGVTNAKLRTHFAIRCDPGSKMRVADQSYEWREGELAVFDDSFEHEVWAGGCSPRIVLIIDSYHPDLNEDEIEFLTTLEGTPTPLFGNRSLRQGYQKLSARAADNACWVYS